MTTRKTYDAPTRFKTANAATELRHVRDSTADAPDAIDIARAVLAARTANAWRGDGKVPTDAEIAQTLREDAELAHKAWKGLGHSPPTDAELWAEMEAAIEADVIERERLANAERSQNAWRTAPPIAVVIRTP